MWFVNMVNHLHHNIPIEQYGLLVESNGLFTFLPCIELGKTKHKNMIQVREAGHVGW